MSASLCSPERKNPEKDKDREEVMLADRELVVAIGAQLHSYDPPTEAGDNGGFQQEDQWNQF